MKRALSLAVVISFMSFIAFAQQSKYQIGGKWQGKFPPEVVNNASDADNPIAVEIEVKEDNGKLAGTSTFYLILNEDNKPKVKGRSDVALIEPQFDGTTLRFSIKVKGQQGEPEITKKMQMKLTSSTEAELETPDDADAPVIKMKKAQ